MTTVVQQQTSSLHVYKMHPLFLLVMFLTCTIVTELVRFFSGESFALTLSLTSRYKVLFWKKFTVCFFFASGCWLWLLAEEDGSSCVLHHNKNGITAFHFSQISLAGFFVIYCLDILKEPSQKHHKICTFVCGSKCSNVLISVRLKKKKKS